MMAGRECASEDPVSEMRFDPRHEAPGKDGIERCFPAVAGAHPVDIEELDAVRKLSRTWYWPIT
jgi:hypothetical protein